MSIQSAPAVDPNRRFTEKCIILVDDLRVVLSDPTNPNSWHGGALALLVRNAVENTSNTVSLILPQISSDDLGMSFMRALTQCSDELELAIVFDHFDVYQISESKDDPGLTVASPRQTRFDKGYGFSTMGIIRLYDKKYFDHYGPDGYTRIFQDHDTTVSVPDGNPTLEEVLAGGIKAHSQYTSVKLFDRVTLADDGHYDHNLTDVRPWTPRA